MNVSRPRAVLCDEAMKLKVDVMREERITKWRTELTHIISNLSSRQACHLPQGHPLEMSATKAISKGKKTARRNKPFQG